MFNVIAPVLALLWAGMILGISFLEAWAKFKTPNVPKLVNLQIGHTVFDYFHFVQWLFLTALLIVLILTYPYLEISIYTITLTLIAIFSLQTFWLMPKFKKNIEILLTGLPLTPSPSHAIYALFEVLKFLLLISLALKLLRPLL